MFATKRKFQNLMSSITSSTNSTKTHIAPTGSDTSAIEPAAPSKRRRVAEPLSMLNKSGLSTTITKVGSASSISVSPRATTNGKVPNYAPWDRVQFLERLKSFRHVDKWSAKPAKINEVQWAKRGWTCAGKERVGCIGGCGKEVAIKLEKFTSVEKNRNEQIGEDISSTDLLEGSQEANDDLIDRYEEMITTEHADYCLWKLRGCDESIQRLHLSNPIDALSSLRLRYQSLEAIASELPQTITAPTSELLSFVTRHGSLLLHRPSTTMAHEDPNHVSEAPHVNKEALAMAIFGWQAEDGHISGLVACSSCFRRLGLWLFSQHGGDKSSDQAAMIGLDVASEHQDYCPWINAQSQDGKSASSQKRLPHLITPSAGWEVLLRGLRSQLRSKDENLLMEGEKSLHSSFEVGVGHGQTDSDGQDEDVDIRLEKEKERWARLRQLKKVFEVKKKRPASAKSTQ
ncbi:MAG: hypothetical protein M1814_004751 [Vezdaea aestivalis]|nr:MAG: hypothetical protein M1814_004751 [Vezdaea aestivalis]